VLVAIQIAGSIVLVMASAQMYRNTLRVLQENPGFNIDHRLTVRLDPSVAGYTPAQTDAFYRTLLERAEALQGVRSAALGHVLPFTTDGIGVAVIPENYEFPAGQRSAGVAANIVDERYFDTLGIPIISGRGFRESDRSGSPRVVVVNDAFAKRFYKGDAVGRHVRIEDGGDNAEIIGITTNGKFNNPVQRESPYLFSSVRQAPRSRMTLVVQTAGDPIAMTTAIRDVIRSIDPNMPIFAVRTLDNIFDRGPAAQLWLFNGVFGATGVMGFFLALVGLYAVVAQQVARRTREIGIRMALGAQRSQVMEMILKQAGIVAGIGIATGLVLSIVTRSALLAALAQRRSSFDPLMLGILPLAILVVTLFAAAIPARRASRIDPLAALRQD
jgi:predicted permease